ncbi:MAG: 2-phospho-L-lactate transferase [Acidimicrobiales bacterium]
MTETAAAAEIPLVVTVICGGVGAARLLTGIRRVVGDERAVTAIANVGDDLELHGLQVSPDLDTIVYTTAGAVSQERGWGLEGETWQAMDTVSRYGGPTWFSLGDRDIGTHLYRTHRRGEGATLSTVTAEIAAAWGLGFRLLPVTDDRLRTMVTVADGAGSGTEITFQEYFVGRGHDVAVRAVRFDGAETARPAPGVLEAIATAPRIVIAPSNPIVSIDPVLAVPGVRAALAARRADVVAVSPIIGGKALKGPADRLLTEMGGEASAVGVARWYQDLIGTLIVDTADAGSVADIAALGITPVVMPTVMSDPDVTDRLAESVCDTPGSSGTMA